METEGNEYWTRDESPFVFPSRILGLEIRAARVMGTHSVLLCEGFDVLLPVTQNGISQWIVWLG